MRLFLLFLLASTVACEPAPPIDPSPDIDALFSAYVGSVPGAAILVVQNDEILAQRVYGMADVAAGIPVTARTNFRLASVTKQFTATAVLQLVADGRFGLDDPLTAVLPGFPPYGADISVRHLLSHTSGLLDYESLMPDSTTVQIRDEGVLDLMRSADSTYFPPGSAYRYSNSGYAVLAMLIEHQSGERFADYLTNHVFAPAGMTTSIAFEDGRSTVADRAFGYAVTESTAETTAESTAESTAETTATSEVETVFTFADQSTTSAVLGDGGIYSSLEDLRVWDAALYGNDVLDQSVLAQTWTPAVSIPGGDVHYGFGWRLDRFLGHRRMIHTGSTSGFRNVIQRYPDARTTVIILTNRNGPDVSPLADQVAELFLNKLGD